METKGKICNKNLGLQELQQYKMIFLLDCDTKEEELDLPNFLFDEYEDLM